MASLHSITLDDCWHFAGYIMPNGYGKLPNQTLAHRTMYEVEVGEIPEGLHIDHLCRNRRCINPKHLEPVTAKENTIRGFGLAAQRSKQTHCTNGHLFEANNIYYHPKRNTRNCKKCVYIRGKKRTLVESI